MFRANLPSSLTMLVFVLGFAGPAPVQEAKSAETKQDHGDLTTKATNPVGSLVQLQDAD